MSWISVDQKLLGGKLRELRKEIGCSRNEAIGVLIGLWLWGMDNATPEGMLRGCDRDDLCEVITTGMDRRYEPERVIQALIEKGWVDTDGSSFLIHDWEEWRKHYNKFVKDADANRRRQKEYRERHAGEAKEETETAAELADIAPEKTRADEIPSEPKKSTYSADFTAFWKAYPRHNDKGQAYRKYQTRLKDGYSPQELLAAAEAYAAECKRKRTEPDYIKHAKTFLGDSTPFTEYLPKARDEEPQEKTDPNANPFL